MTRLLCVLSLLLLATCQVPKNAPKSGLSSGVAGKTPSLFNSGNRFMQFSNDHYVHKVQPTLGKRCVVCHGCQDAPCNLKLNSYSFVNRGANVTNFFAASLISDNEAPIGTQYGYNFWGDTAKADPKGFYKVTTRDNNRSIFQQFVAAGAKNDQFQKASGFALGGVGRGKNSPAKNYQLFKSRVEGADARSYQCPNTTKSAKNYLTKHPLNGMPFGMAPVSKSEFKTLMDFGVSPKPPQKRTMEFLTTASNLNVIKKWEDFFNESSREHQAVARYVYEHVYSAHIHFESMPGEFFRLVRLRLDPRKRRPWRAIDEIVTPRPIDSPGVKRVFYGLKKVDYLITAKNHVLWEVSDKVLERMKQNFFPKDRKWKITKDIPYDQFNPYIAFAEVPAKMRYRFLLNNSHMIVSGMVRGAVCIGSSATYAISDHFYAFFLDPEIDPTAKSPGEKPSANGIVGLSQEGFEGLDMSAEGYIDYSRLFGKNKVYLQEQEKAMRQSLDNRRKRGEINVAGLGVNDIWDGDGYNPNAWLTILRHGQSATVHRGPVGGFPKTVWVLNYANFERVYYDLVAHFKYWGQAGHKIGTWRTMSHIRLHGEDTFLSFVPENDKERIRFEWAGGLEIPSKLVSRLLGAKRYIDFFPLQNRGRPTRMNVRSGPGVEVQIVQQFADRLKGIKFDNYEDKINGDPRSGNPVYAPREKYDAKAVTSINSFDDFEKSFAKVNYDRGKQRYATFFPSITFLRIKNGDNCQRAEDCRLYTILNHRGYLSHHSFLFEEKKRDPKRDTITLHRGVFGDYPNMFLDMNFREAATFLNGLHKMTTDVVPRRFQALRKQFMVSRFSKEFWEFSDWAHRQAVLAPMGYKRAGILDLSYYEFD